MITVLLLILLGLCSASEVVSDNRTEVWPEEEFNKTRDENHPLLTLMETRPHSMSLMVKVRTLQPETMVRLLYERVPLNKQPLLQHLDDPVIEYIHLSSSPHSHHINELPMGKYIVCGEAMVKGDIYQSSCFETLIERLDNNSKYHSAVSEFDTSLLCPSFHPFLIRNRVVIISHR